MPKTGNAADTSVARDIIQANACTDAALAFLRDRHIPTTPNNYSVAYEYVSPSGDPRLKRHIDQLLVSGTRFTQTVCNGLHTTFFSSESESRALRVASASMKKELEKLINNLECAGKDTSKFGDDLGIYSKALSSAPEFDSLGDTLHTLVGKILQDTKLMEEKSRTLEGELTSSSHEINKLRQNLEMVRTESLTDPLTGIGNRKYFDESFDEAVANTKEGNSIALIMADIDHFKSFNDTWGHQMGDQVLKIVAKCMKHEIDAQGRLARYGGEEFSIILPNTNVENAIAVAEKIRKLVAKQQMKKKSTGEVIGRITVSFGVGLYKPGESFAELTQRADEALYAAKKAGRNMVKCEDFSVDEKKSA